MKKYLLLLVLPLVFACNTSDKKTVNANVNNDSLTTTNNELSGQLQSKDAIIDDFLKSFNEIQENLSSIKSKQQSVSLSTNDVEMKKSLKEQIINDIQFINDLLSKNRKTINSLNEKLNNSNAKNAELERTVSHLNTMVNENEEEINSLKTRLEKLNIKLGETSAAYEKERQLAESQTNKLNTAYCTIGTKNELIKRGVMTKDGGFIGLGKVKDLSPNTTEGMFSPIDIYQTREISIGARKVRLVTEHTKGSYKMDTKYGVKTLTILSPDEFWKTSKFLIIEISAETPDYE